MKNYFKLLPANRLKIMQIKAKRRNEKRPGLNRSSWSIFKARLNAIFKGNIQKSD
tara:strand:- start:1996 stop:2160 length:165 start_codon:yes stop_codon:yes gene_type:complete